MDKYFVTNYQRQNLLHTLFLVSGMLLLLSSIGWLIAGQIGILWAFVTGASILLITPKVSPLLILHLYGAQKMPPQISTQLDSVVQWLSKRSHLSLNPDLYYIPSSVMLAFSVGMNKNASIAISNGLLRQLNLREITAVLAHEISHIQSKDIWVMNMADIISRLTQFMSMIGYLLILFYVPFFVFTGEDIPWIIFILLLIAPIISTLMQLALSRTREFNADIQACKLTGDPGGLISALKKIDYYEKHWFKILVQPGKNIPNPSILRTHPLTEERIRRLKLITQEESNSFIDRQQEDDLYSDSIERKPRQHLSGLWH